MSRKFRITWSVAWGIVAVLLCVLWVRSYWAVDSIETRKSPSIWVIASGRGALGFGCDPLVSQVGVRDWKFETYPPDDDEQFPEHSFLHFYIEHSPGKLAVILPYWFLVPIFAAVVAVPWVYLPSKFSLRTLLIATALVAVGLGLIVWVVH